MDMPPVFTTANQYLLSQAYDKAYVLFDLLAKRYPDFQPYRTNRELVKPFLEQPKLAIARKLANRALHAGHFLFQDGRNELAQWCIDQVSENPDAWLCRANGVADKFSAAWLELVNQFLAGHGAAQLAAADAPKSSSIVLNGIRSVPSLRSSADGPLVTVMMSCFNAEHTLSYAVHSLLAQTHGNFELYIVNDNSTDGSAVLAEKLASQDSRIKTIHNTSNQGTYVARNTVFAQCKGRYFTTLDADDLALPDRLEKQIAVLEGNQRLVGTLGNWVRISPAGEFVFKNWTSSYLHEAVATLMVCREKVLEGIGYWDSVRYAADTEFHHRLMKRFGADAVLKMHRPLCLALYHPASLTQDASTGISETTGISGTRLAYRNAWKRWHQMNTHVRIDFPTRQRPFQAPLEML